MENARVIIIIMSEKNSGFRNFYQEYVKEDSNGSVVGKLAMPHNFEVQMANGRSPVIIDWERVMFGCLGVALLFKGVYFWQK